MSHIENNTKKVIRITKKNQIEKLMIIFDGTSGGLIKGPEGDLNPACDDEGLDLNFIGLAKLLSETVDGRANDTLCDSNIKSCSDGLFDMIEGDVFHFNDFDDFDVTKESLMTSVGEFNDDTIDSSFHRFVLSAKKGDGVTIPQTGLYFSTQ